MGWIIGGILVFALTLWFRYSVNSLEKDRARIAAIPDPEERARQQEALDAVYTNTHPDGSGFW